VTSKKLPLESSKNSKAEPATMEELLAKTGYNLHGFVKGQEVEGEVVEITPSSLILDIHGKSEGIVTGKVFEEASDFIKTLKLHDKVLGTVVIPEMEDGRTLISLRNQARSTAYDKLEEAVKNESQIKVEGRSVIRGGVTVEVFGILGFIPMSQLSKEYQTSPAKLIAQSFPVRVLEVDRSDSRVILSQKAVSDAGILKKIVSALKKIKVGQIFEGEISGITNFGAFVKIGETDGQPIEGLVHISELSYSKIINPEEVVKVGDKVKVKVLEKDEKNGRLSLSIKQTLEDPWEHVTSRYKVDKTVKGKITRISDWGVFVELEPGVEGMLHFSKIPAGLEFKEGQEIDCFIEEVDEKARKIGLGLVLKEKPVTYK